MDLKVSSPTALILFPLKCSHPTSRTHQICLIKLLTICIFVMLLLTEGDKGDDDNRTEILFDRLMLMELREIMGKLDPKSYAELRSYNEPPKVINVQ